MTRMNPVNKRKDNYLFILNKARHVKFQMKALFIIPSVVIMRIQSNFVRFKLPEELKIYLRQLNLPSK